MQNLDCKMSSTLYVSREEEKVELQDLNNRLETFGELLHAMAEAPEYALSCGHANPGRFVLISFGIFFYMQSLQIVL
jgi:hypothetical protein